MDEVRLHFTGVKTAALPLSKGSYRIGWHNGGLRQVDEQADAWIKISVDRRGIWLRVCHVTASVYVNGRRIYQLALLRSGDVIHLDRTELRLISATRPLSSPAPASTTSLAADPRWVVRALGGPDHGRCFPLDRPRLVGRSSNADLHIDDPACGEAHAWLEWDHGQVRLRHLGASAHSLVNGQALHEAALGVGDQVAFSPRQRIVIEAPHAPRSPPEGAATPVQALSQPRPRALWPLLWLLVAAALLAALLAGVLFFGVA